MFERFTERARQVVVLAQDEARALKHNYISTEHILLGLLREESGVAARTLAHFDVGLDDLRIFVKTTFGVGETPVVLGHLAPTTRCKKAFELAAREALSLGHNYIGTEHLLLGLLCEQGAAARCLNDRGADVESVRAHITQMLATRPPAAAQERLRVSPPKPSSLAVIATELTKIRGLLEQLVAKS